jgi:PIN domain nuclease of toxin-antitoxin system
VSGGDPDRGYLLDTNAALFAMFQSQKLSLAAKNAIAAGPNVVSVVAYWEVMLKSMKGTLDVGDPRTWWETALQQLNATALMLRPQHVDALYGLPDHHKDPFDRMLIAQALSEGLTLVSGDREMARYKSAGLKIVR